MLPTLTNAKKFLQRDALFFQGVKSFSTHLMKSNFLKFVNPRQVAQSNLKGILASVNFADPAIQVNDEKILLATLHGGISFSRFSPMEVFLLKFKKNAVQAISRQPSE